VLLSLNPELPEEAIAGAVEELSRDRTALSLVEANGEIDKLLKGGEQGGGCRHFPEHPAARDL
jgi:type I site-specific restriction-modification system R (restriction) subunit